jgi:ATP/maltotriose-dependent transcriptional regulator MalT
MAQLFQQKLIIPTAAHALVERDAIVARLDQAILTKRLVVLAAPAGWGKTTILAQWAARSRQPVVWYTLGPSDRDPHVFLEYLLHALAPVVPGARAIAEQLNSTSPQGLAERYRAAALEISGVDAPFALVLDDFHVMEDELAPAIPGTDLIFELLGAIMEYAAGCHLVLASRVLPDRQGLARMVVQQRATVFDYLTLQFTVADIQSLASASARLRLDDASAAHLAAQFGGWAAGIVLSLSQAAQGRDQLVPDGQVDVTQIYDFFAEQIVAPLDPELQCFLEDISVLEDLSPQRCNALRGRSDSARFLNDARRRGLFTAHRGEWLVYHSLFRDFLRSRLAQDPQREQALLRSAGDLYRDEDDIARAIDCYLAARAVDEVIALLQAAVPRFLQLSRQTLLLSCFERLSAHLAQSNQPQRLPPEVLLLQARVYRDLALWERAELALQLAAALGNPEVRAEAAIWHAELLSLQSDHERATRVLGTVAVAPLQPRLQFAYYCTAGRVQILSEQIDAAIASFEQAHTIILSSADVSSDPSTLATIYDLLGWAYVQQSNGPMALRYLQRADACWQAVGNRGRRTTTLNNLGVVALEERRYAEARAAFQSGLELARQTSRRREEVDLLCNMADLDLIEGHVGQALAVFREAYEIAVRMDLVASGEAAIGALWAAAIQGDVAEAGLWLQHVQAKEQPRALAARARSALARSLLLLRQPRPDLSAIVALAAQAGAAQSLISIDRMALALLRATIAFEQRGWSAASAEWEAFVQSSAGLPEPLLTHFVVFHRRLFDAAATSAPLARRLVAARQSASPRHWQIMALGNFACLVDGVACDLSPLHRALLVCLLDAGQQGLGVEQLWEQIWGESDISMSALHQALYRLRSQTGLSVAAREGVCNIYSPWEAIEYDVRALEKILGQPIGHQMIQRAAELYRGDFLLSAPLSAAHWADARRDHLRQRYLDALEGYATLVEREVPERAIQYYQRVLSIDGCREQTAARLMRLAAGSGNYSLVTETFEHLESSLRLLGATPETATRELLHVGAVRGMAKPSTVV